MVGDERAMISIVIPTLNEARALPHTLQSVAAHPETHEVIISDGGSSDATRDAALTHGARWVNGPRGRGAQMNTGARAAHCAPHEWLLFLHADTHLPAGALQALERLPPGVTWGGFQQAFDDTQPLLRAVSRLHNWRARRTRILYGDQAMFVRRRVFDSTGGFPECDLEDVQLSERLRAQACPVLMPLTVVTDARKFVAHGVVRSMVRIVALLLCHRYGLPLRGRRFLEAVR
jgi:rSAM/selenodomain-associated transferase 2